MSGSSGDFAFTSSGELIIVADSNIYKVNEPTPAVAGSVALTTALITTLPNGVMGNGIAFGNNGHIFVSSSPQAGTGQITEINPATKTEIGSYPIAYAPTDMASCAYPNTVTLKGSVNHAYRRRCARHAERTQFTHRTRRPKHVRASQCPLSGRRATMSRGPSGESTLFRGGSVIPQAHLRSVLDAHSWCGSGPRRCRWARLLSYRAVRKRRAHEAR